MMEKQILINRIQDLAKPLSPSPPGHETCLKTLPGIKCVAFDFYGTMFISGVGDIGIDEEQDIQNASHFKSALRDTGFSVSGDKAGVLGVELFQSIINRYISRMKDEGIEYPEPDIVEVWTDVLNKLSGEGYIQGEVTHERAVRFAIEFEFRVNSIWPVPDLARILNELLEHGYKLGVISNSQFYTPLAFEAIIGSSPQAFGFDPDLLVWSYATRMKKPSVEFYKTFTDVLEDSKKMLPEEVLYVGNDVRKDIQPAKQLGMKTALFVGDSRSVRHNSEDLEREEFQPSLIIDDLSQILGCVNSKL